MLLVIGTLVLDLHLTCLHAFRLHYAPRCYIYWPASCIATLCSCSNRARRNCTNEAKCRIFVLYSKGDQTVYASSIHRSPFFYNMYDDKAGDRSLATIHGTSRRDSSRRQDSESGRTATPTRPAPQDGLLPEPMPERRIRGDRWRRRIHSPERSATVDKDAEEAEGRLPDRLCSKGLRALTTMLMLGRKSPSYCTHRAATAAIW